MKSNKYILLICLSILMITGCKNDFFDLDKKPLNIISDAYIFEDKGLVDSYMANMYEDGLFFYGEQDNPVFWTMDEGLGAVCRNIAYWQAPSSLPLLTMDENGAGQLTYWDYGTIRFINTFIEGMKSSALPEDYVKVRILEAKCLRANVYFNMAKRYGGVPLITKPQKITDSQEELYPKRNSEKEVYDFIASELDAAIAGLPETSDRGRFNKYAAHALKSRAMLFAASVAQFGTVQLNGLLGINKSEAPKYWQKAYDAANAIITSAKYELYQNHADKAKNFQELFVDESASNKEPILSVVFDPDLGKGNSWNVGAVPFEFRAAWGSNYCPFLNIIEEFEYNDGTPGDIDRDLINGDHLFDINTVFRNRDPRFLATFFFPEAEWQGGVVRFHKKTIKDGQTLTSGTVDGVWPAASPKRNNKATGFLVRKRMDEGEFKPLKKSSDEDYHLYRYAEILLNFAEAAFYLNKKDESLDKINMVRSRAGMPSIPEATEEAIRHERTVELVFEDHRYWDLRRWRTAHTFLNGLQTKGLTYTYHYDEKKYDFHLINADPSLRVFQERHYYWPLGVSITSDNTNLVENPGY